MITYGKRVYSVVFGHKGVVLMAKHILSVLVQNHSGVLSRVSGLFSRRGFNIDSVASGITEDPNISRITIVVDGDEYIIDQVIKQLNKLIDVLRIKHLDSNISVKRELALIKVKANLENRGDILRISEIFRAKIVDVTTEAVTIEISGPNEKINALEDMIREYGIIESVRTGTIAIERGNDFLCLKNNNK